MPTQNLISATLPQGDRDEILRKLTEIRAKLGFLVTLNAEEIQHLIKAANGFAPFLDKTARVVEDHPEIFPGTFDREEFQRDYELFQALKPLCEQVRQLSQALENTHTALASDLMTSGLEVYGAVKQNSGKIAGLGAVRDDLSVFFKRTRKEKPAAAV